MNIQTGDGEMHHHLPLENCLTCLIFILLLPGLTRIVLTCLGTVQKLHKISLRYLAGMTQFFVSIFLYRSFDETDLFFLFFVRYVEGKVAYLPWCETPLQPESLTIGKELAALNRLGFLTINSQPSVNGAPSTHKTFGWGRADGYIYQKGYCECFVSPDNAQKLVSMVKAHKQMNLYAVNRMGEELRVNVGEGGVTALTWGVFPSHEIQQPTIFDPDTFLVWAEEAFSLWTGMWLNLYEMESDSYDLIETIRDTYYLVAIIDNDFISDMNGGHLWHNLLTLNHVK